MINYPFVSFLIPVWNEEKNIKRCLDSLLNQDYPKNKFEILLADGNSSDNTVGIIKKFIQKNKNIKLLKNPRRNTAIGRNICLREAKGEIVINYSGHVFAKNNLIRALALRLSQLKMEVGAVGCSNFSPHDQSFIGNSVGIIFRSIFGGVKSVDQNKRYNKEKYVKSVAFTAYRKELIEMIGGFDPKFWVGQDGELNLRLRKTGYKILYTPKTAVFHYKRNSIKKFFRQMYRYGIARLMVIKKHPDTFKIVYLLPSFFLISIIIVLVLSFLKIIPFLFLLGGVILYSLVGIFFSSLVSKKILPIIVSPFFYFLEHLSYGLGFLGGIFFKGFK
ncbi:glycosyltransferase [Nanoarchaeota archaeon]